MSWLGTLRGFNTECVLRLVSLPADRNALTTLDPLHDTGNGHTQTRTIFLV